MATATLKFTVGTLSGTKTMNFRLAKTNVSQAAVKSFAETLVENGSIYRYPPMTVEKAVLQIVSETTFDLG